MTESERLFEQVYRTYGPSLYRFCLLQMKDPADAEDVLQEVFCKRLYRAPEFPSPEQERRWLFRVAANCAGDLFRSAWRRRSRPLEEAEHVAAPGEDEEAGEVLRAVLSLPEHYRAAIHLFYYEGYSTAQIANILGKNEITVRSWLRRGRGKLKEILKEAYDFEETV